MINFCFNIIVSYDVVFPVIRRDSVSLLRFPFLSQWVRLLVYILASLLLEISIEFFFPFLLPSFFLYIYSYVVCVVTSCCHSSFFSLFNVVLEFFNWCIYRIFNVDKSTSSSFSWNIVRLCYLSALCMVLNFPPLSILRMVLIFIIIKKKEIPQYTTYDYNFYWIIKIN